MDAKNCAKLAGTGTKIYINPIVLKIFWLVIVIAFIFTNSPTIKISPYPKLIQVQHQLVYSCDNKLVHK